MSRCDTEGSRCPLSNNHCRIATWGECQLSNNDCRRSETRSLSGNMSALIAFLSDSSLRVMSAFRQKLSLLRITTATRSRPWRATSNGDRALKTYLSMRLTRCTASAEPNTSDSLQMRHNESAAYFSQRASVNSLSWRLQTPGAALKDSANV